MSTEQSVLGTQKKTNKNKKPKTYSQCSHTTGPSTDMWFHCPMVALEHTQQQPPGKTDGSIFGRLLLKNNTPQNEANIQNAADMFFHCPVVAHCWQN